jgi:hypothetical protein
MDHAYIQEHQIVFRYSVGKLEATDRVEFEDHLVDCPQCMDELDLTDDFRYSLRSAASQSESQIPGNARSAVGWHIGFQRRGIAVLAVASLIVVSFVSVFFVRQNRLLQGDLDLARIDRQTWERQYNDEHRARTDAESHLLDTQAGAAPLFTLNLTRSANLNGRAPSNAISIPRETKSIVLSMEWQNDSDFQSYRATLSDAAGNRVWGVDRIVPPSGTLALIVPASVIRAGDYVLVIEGQHGNQYSAAGSYSFRASLSK